MRSKRNQKEFNKKILFHYQIKGPKMINLMKVTKINLNLFFIEDDGDDEK